MSKAAYITLYSFPLTLGVASSYLFWQHNDVLLVFYTAVIIGMILVGKDKKTEFWAWIYGIVAGTFIEIIGTQISGYQHFTNPDAIGVPYWIIACWGYGFVLMKRIALVIATGAPWASGEK